MNKGFAIIATLALAAAFISPVADAQSKATKKKPVKKTAKAYSGPETGLVGVKLFDTGLRVVALYGNPDEIQSVSGGGVTTGGGGGGGRGGFGGPGGPPGAASGPGGRGGAGGGSRSGPADDGAMFSPFDYMEGTLMQMTPTLGPGAGSPDGGGPGGMRPPGGQPGAGGPGGFGGPGGPGGPGGLGGQATSSDYTRWIYNRNGSKYGFVVDKFNRVIQIEAMGLQNQKVKTRRGIGFGSTFSQVLKSYAKNPPDGYDINGDTVTMRYLTRDRVAFRLVRLGNKKVHVVTAMVVAAGKQ